MKKVILSLLLLIPTLFLSSCSLISLIPRGDIVIKVITTKETNEWDKKDALDKKYYAVYSNGAYPETDEFSPDDVTEYHVSAETFSSKISGNRIVNTVVHPTVRDRNDNLITPDGNILGIIYAAANTIKHDIWKFTIIKDKEKYFAFIWLNVNWSSPCELYEYDTDNQSLHQLCEWNNVDIVGISVPNSTKDVDSSKNPVTINQFAKQSSRQKVNLR